MTEVGRAQQLYPTEGKLKLSFTSHNHDFAKSGENYLLDNDYCCISDGTQKQQLNPRPPKKCNVNANKNYIALMSITVSFCYFFCDAQALTCF